MDIIPLPAFRDNYIWLVHDGRHALVVDPGDAAPVQDALARYGLTLSAILLTHHHPDHVGGVSALCARHRVPVYGPAAERIEGVDRPLGDGDQIRLDAPAAAFHVIEVPGHTAGHIAFIGTGPSSGVLFCGDTLFSAGCGRLFEGTPAQLAASLARLCALPDDTWVYCTHEYTLSNLAFARAAEPDNDVRDAYALHCEALRARGEPTLPSTIGREKAVNPFLRCTQPAVLDALALETGTRPADALACLTALRAWKDRF
ncbi:hydroxyacylglutathione hydrolase [Thauera aromatica]|uniref:Hydroxyacylglutathione hydrolase n=1 Tax=Thauera aromatica K172 TaxID=44139 RepID=A0A2R4BP69_THAAR|nr:hydroxyacylglutathione hydrolase [Thauera aromatica]AVR89070.1 Hydroxyacylglutathione hydrolase [Thauera aromatica K172]